MTLLRPAQLAVLGASLLAAASAAAASPSPASSTATAVAAGDFHSCALTASGGVKCWGRNNYGQLGDGTQADHSVPGDVAGLASGVQDIAAGLGHTCALTGTGGVKCWGRNSFGQLGDGTQTDRFAPVDVTGLASGVQAIAAGRTHTCALMSTGGVKCWGRNSSGQLGDGTTTNRSTPVDVAGLSSGVAALAAGFGHTCALLSAGGVDCWGRNGSGQLGDGTTTNRSTPVAVPGLSGAQAIAAGNEHTCAVTGGVKCWGGSDYGQVGDGSTAVRLSPVDVTGLASGVTAVAAGDVHTCALAAAGAAKCWGSNAEGQLGDGQSCHPVYCPTPVDVTGLASGMAAIAGGGEHTCAVATAGWLKCWGSNLYGQLGDGTRIDRSTPADVSGFEGPKTLAVAKGGRGTGKVRSSPVGIDCGATCSHDFDYGTSVTLTAAASARSSFKGWSGDCSGTGTCTLKMSVNRSVTATFDLSCIVPNVKGKMLTAAKSAIKRAHCSVGRVKKAFSAKRKGTVVSQKPAPRTRLAEGSRVSLTVSKGRLVMGRG